MYIYRLHKIYIDLHYTQGIKHYFLKFIDNKNIAAMYFEEFHLASALDVSKDKGKEGLEMEINS